MTGDDRHHRMSNLDRFGLCTGLIGLVADFVTIGSLGRFGGQYHLTPTAVWVIIPVLIMYTTIILSFYARRIALARHLSTERVLSQETLVKINLGGRASALSIGAPLLLLYGVSLFISFGDKADTPSFTIFMIFIGIPLALLVSGTFNWVAGVLYKAFDPGYHA